jgi:hypothetical protein
MINREGGYFSFTAFIVILLLAALSTGLFLLQSASLLLEKRVTIKIPESDADRLIEQMVMTKLDDETPDGDSSLDDFWRDFHEQTINGWTIKLEDLSSRPNLNLVDPEMLYRTDLKKYVSVTKTAEDFSGFRINNGFTLDPNDYQELFLGTEWISRFSVYGCGNINILPEESLEIILEERNVDKSLAGVIIEKRKSGYFTTETFLELDESAGDSLFPLANTEAGFNVNTMDEYTLQVVFEYVWGKQEGSHFSYLDKKGRILNDRTYREIGPEELTGILGLEDSLKEIYQYLGTKTWFWKVNMTGFDKRITWVLVRRPSASKNGEDSYQIISKHVEKEKP